MLVFDERITGHTAVLPAHGDQAELALEADELLEDQRTLPHEGQRLAQVGRLPEHTLALAVVAEAPCLQHAWVPQSIDGFAERRLVVDGFEARGGDVQALEAALFDESILRHPKRVRRRKHPRGSCE